MKREGKGREVVCGQVWWPILGICPLHLTHPSAHSQQWTHTRSSGQPCCGARGAVGGSVPCSRVSPQSWYWGWREHLLFTPPTDNPCRTWDSNLQPLGYKSNSLTIRPRLPLENQERAVPDIPTAERREIRKSWEMVLKAELRSSSRSRDSEPVLQESNKPLTTFTTAVSVLCRGRKPNWNRSKRLRLLKGDLCNKCIFKSFILKCILSHYGPVSETGLRLSQD